MKTARRKNILITIVLLSGLVAFISYVHHLQLRSAVRQYMAELENKGEIFDWRKLIPVPPDQNQVSIVKKIFSQLKWNRASFTNSPETMRLVAPGHAEVVWQQPDVRSYKWATNSWEQIQTELDDTKTEINLLKSLIDHSTWNFGLDYSQGWELPLPHLMKWKEAMLWLTSDAMVCLHNHQPDEACRDVRAMVALVKGQADEPLLISQSIRLATAQLAANATWQLLQYPDISDDKLAQLQDDWESIEFIRPLERAYLMERAISMQTLQRMRKMRNPLQPLPPAVGNTSPFAIRTKWNITRWRWYSSYKDELLALQTFQVLFDVTPQMAKTNCSFQVIQSCIETNFSRLHLNSKKEEGHRIDYEESELEKVLMNLFSRVAQNQFDTLDKVITADTMREIVVTAIALKRFKLLHGNYPSTLNELVPELLKALPKDRMDGGILRYHNETNLFLLYSTGLDCKDNGGDLRLPDEERIAHSWLRGRDLVWPKPASEEEIKADDERILKPR